MSRSCESSNCFLFSLILFNSIEYWFQYTDKNERRTEFCRITTHTDGYCHFWVDSDKSGIFTVEMALAWMSDDVANRVGESVISRKAAFLWGISVKG